MARGTQGVLMLTITKTLTCEGPNCQNAVTLSAAFNEAEIRAVARQQGWKTVEVRGERHIGSDLCPIHGGTGKR